ncbi:LANO_0E02608g1_1 [Lachancea nothofagi CBS 11611]|uniref:Large ribosomal subunit protein bL28m n=1 Tax=Lachancea nothofagi CBS 11611 TaxID=1266666 RepID=A0A1G4JQ73_9SACH|nr:LANO_0E02608g1_1 [Lachancea nothofagi CBS 11611]
MSFNGLTLKRGFSSVPAVFREWRLVESRSVAKQPEVNAGDNRPVYVPKNRKAFPDYEYGESHIFKQSNKGLYGGSFVQYGNNVAESKTKTRRRWLPNVVRKGLWSESLARNISIRMTAKVLKTVTKEGGIDNYLTKEKSARIKELGPTGWRLRYRVLQRQDLRENPPHKDAAVVETPEGLKTKVYFEESVNGEALRVTCGRRKLLQYLYPLEKLEHRADGLELTHKAFLDLYAGATTLQVLEALHKYGFDLKSVCV